MVAIMKRSVSFAWLDVFAEQPHGGNPLAVLDGSSLPEEALLSLTRELSLSETTFIFPPTRPGEADAKVRIFTQAKEVPFAGHPVLGTAAALLLSGRIAWQAPSTTVRLELGIGVVPVTVEGEAQPERARFSHSRIGVSAAPIEDERLAWLPPALGLSSSRLGARIVLAGKDRKLPAQVVSGGAQQLMVPVESPEAVDEIAASYNDVVAAERLLGSELGILAFAFTTPPDPNRPVQVRARFFAHDAPNEDPATGSAAAALAVYLHHHGVLRPGQTLEIDQGPLRGRIVGTPGRRSLLRASCDGKSVQVEGRVREVLRGDVELSLES
jgi:trans-2,3-dihydro-3-hydroxyanthranilate isomerase